MKLLEFHLYDGVATLYYCFFFILDGVNPLVVDEVAQEHSVNKNNIITNSSTTHRKFQHECHICWKSFDRVWELQLHNAQHSAPDLLQQNQSASNGIEKRTSQRKTTESLAVKNSNTFHKCGQCGQRFASKRRFYIHLRTHGPLPYSCQYCLKSFPSFQGLRKHTHGTCQKKQQTTAVNTTTEAGHNRSTDQGKFNELSISIIFHFKHLCCLKPKLSWSFV